MLASLAADQKTSSITLDRNTPVSIIHTKGNQRGIRQPLESQHKCNTFKMQERETEYTNEIKIYKVTREKHMEAIHFQHVPLISDQKKGEKRKNK
jgi:hypothetical protein